MKVYLAGPMRGFPLYNFPRFHEVTKTLRKWGYEVINPAEEDEKVGIDPSKPISQELIAYRLEADFAMIEECEAIVFLPGWQASSGAVSERFHAMKHDLRVYEYIGVTDEGVTLRCLAAGVDDKVEIAKRDTSFDPYHRDGRQFETGAYRDADDDKLDYEGFLSPVVLKRYAQYLHEHRVQSNGDMRPSDNWQQGIPQDVYMKSGFRHFMEWWEEHRNDTGGKELEDAICALIFNAMGYLFEELKNQ